MPDSEDDVEDVCNVMRNATSRGYHKPGGIIILSPAEQDWYLNRLTKVAYWINGETLHIQVPVFIWEGTDGTWSDFSKADNSSCPSRKSRSV